MINISKKKTHEQYVQEVKNKFENIDVVGIYINAITKVLHRCKVCKYEWDSKPNNVLNSCGCPKCTQHKNNLIKTKTHEQFLEEISVNNKNVKIIGKYNGAKSNIKTECVKCGHQWFARPGNLLKGHGCPKCSGNAPITHEDFIKRLNGVLNHNIEILGKYIDSHTKVKCKCNKCGKILEIVPHSLYSGVGCKDCSDKEAGLLKRKPHEQFISEMKTINDNIKILGIYQNSQDKIQCKCTICGHIWSAKPTHLLNYHGCPNCFNIHLSKGEKKIEEICKKYKLTYETQKRFSDLRGIGNNPLSYDFYLPEYKLLIEFQGEQHERVCSYFGGIKNFEKQQEHDKRKREYAKQNNIELLEIWYYDINNIEEILTKTINNLKSKSVETIAVA